VRDECATLCRRNAEGKGDVTTVFLGTTIFPRSLFTTFLVFSDETKKSLVTFSSLTIGEVGLVYDEL
jgi:hypothetical protein